MQPALREERPPLVTIWKGTARKEPKTNKRENCDKERHLVKRCECASVSPQKRHSGGVSNLFWAEKNKKLKLHQKPNNRDSRWQSGWQNEWHQWRPSASVESWRPGGLTAVCDFSAQTWKMKARDQKASLQWTVRTASDEPQRSLASQAWQTLADQTNCFSPSKSCSASFLLFF